MMIAKLLRLFPILSLLLATGCQTETASTDSAPRDQVAEKTRSPIAVIDLTRLADGIGATQKIRDALRDTERDLLSGLIADNEGLASAGSVQSLQEFTTVAREKYSELSAEQQQTLNEETQMAQAVLLKRQLELREQFQVQVSGVAFEVARERGFDTVLTTAQVFATTAEHDITAEVIARIQARNQAPAATGDQAPVSTAKLPGGGNFPIR